jgi:acetyltransferase-like isoleucine patch superfamily enzyme
MVTLAAPSSQDHPGQYWYGIQISLLKSGGNLHTGYGMQITLLTLGGNLHTGMECRFHSNLQMTHGTNFLIYFFLSMFPLFLMMVSQKSK